MRLLARAVEDCVEAGRRGLCTSSDALMALSPVDMRHMDAAEQRWAQLTAMFDRPELRALPVGIMPRSGAWTARPAPTDPVTRARDFMAM